MTQALCFFPRGMMQLYSPLNDNIRFDIEACNANYRQLTFQYFTQSSVDLTMVSVDQKCFQRCVAPDAQQQKLLENKLQIGGLIVPGRIESVQLFKVTFQKANHYAVQFCNTELLFLGSDAVKLSYAFFYLVLLVLHFLTGVFSCNFSSSLQASYNHKALFSPALVQHVFPTSWKNNEISRLRKHPFLTLSLEPNCRLSLLFQHLAETRTWMGLL